MWAVQFWAILEQCIAVQYLILVHSQNTTTGRDKVMNKGKLYHRMGEQVGWWDIWDDMGTFDIWPGCALVDIVVLSCGNKLVLHCPGNAYCELCAVRSLPSCHLCWDPLRASIVVLYRLETLYTLSCELSSPLSRHHCKLWPTTSPRPLVWLAPALKIRHWSILTSCSRMFQHN